MLSKGKMNILFALCLISITSVGFSAWSMGISQDPTQISGNIETDKMINSKDYIYLDTTQGDLVEGSTDKYTGIEVFDYSEYGYMENGVVVDTTYITTYFIINIDECKKMFPTSNSLYSEITLRYTNYTGEFNIFENDGENKKFRSDIIIDSSYSVTKGIAEGIDNKSYMIPLTFNNILQGNESTISFQVKYTLFAQTGDYFKENIYKYLYGDLMNQISFSLTASITNKD